MKRVWAFILVLTIIELAGCGQVKVSKTYEASEKGIMQTYYEMDDGIWKCNDFIYKYRLEIKGRMKNAACDSEFVYLSNVPEISFDRAWRAAGLSSSLNDYFSPQEAVLVEMR